MILLLALIVGLVLGSFGSVLIHRLPERKSLGGRSQCPQCQATLQARDLIPLVSYMMLCGRCRQCRSRMGILYPLVELASGGLFLFSFLYEQDSILVASVLALSLWLLLLISIVDARLQIVPDALSIPLLLVAGLYGLHQSTPADILVSCAVMVAFFGLQWLWSRGRALGSGDVILAGAIGLLLHHWQLAAVCIGISYVTGAVVAVYLLLRKKKHRTDAVAFGPFLALGAFVTLLYGDAIVLLLGL